MIRDSHKAYVVGNDNIIELDYFVKSYIKYLSIFYNKEIYTDTDELKELEKELDKYIRSLMN